MAAIGILWVHYPRWRWLYAASFLVEGSVLVILRWHFASDVIAGGLIGLAGAALTLRYADKP